MWDDQEEDDDDEEDGLAGQLLSDILATSKYGERRGQPRARRHQERGAQGTSHGLVYPLTSAVWVLPAPRGLCALTLPGLVSLQRRITTRMMRKTTLMP